MIELRLPSFGADMDEAEFVHWQVQPGQAVKRGEIACVVETAKGAIDVEIWQEGIVARLIAEPGQHLPVGSPLALLAESGEDWHVVAEQVVTPAAAAPASAAPAPAPAPAPALTPEPSASEASPTRQPVATQAVPAAPPQPAAAMRATIAAAMARSKREIPHYYLQREIVVEPALAWLEAANAARPPAQRLLFAALLLRAVALALADAPALNGRFIDGAFVPGTSVHMAVVTSLRGGGLVIPTLHDVQDLPLPRLMAALNEVLLRARAGRLRSSDLADATITVTNLGDLGADSVHGVIYPPQVALVGAGRIVPRAVVRDGALLAARTVQLTLAADHRVSDGAVGARFLAALAERLDHPEAL